MSEEHKGGCMMCDSYNTCNSRFDEDDKLIYDRICTDGHNGLVELWWKENGHKTSPKNHSTMACFKHAKLAGLTEMANKANEVLDELRLMYPHKMEVYDIESKDKDS